MISRRRLSSISMRPIAAGLAPNFERQYPDIKTTVSGPPGLSSVLENTLPSIGDTPSIGRMPWVTNKVGTSSGSASPVTLTVPVFQSPTSWNTRPSSR